MLKKKRKGQSTVEYIVLFTIVVVVVLSFRATFQNRVGNTVDENLNSMNIMSIRLNGAFKPAN